MDKEETRDPVYTRENMVSWFTTFLALIAARATLAKRSENS